MPHRIVPSGVVFLFASLLFLLASSTVFAQGCDCESLSMDEKFEQADVVFLGVVDESENVEAGDIEVAGQVIVEPEIPYSSLAVLRGTTVWKGSILDQYEVFGGTGEACTINFEHGEQYLVFATGDAIEAMETSECRGTMKLSDAEDQGAIADLGDGSPVNASTVTVPDDQRGAGTRQDSWVMFTVGATGVALSLLAFTAFMWVRYRGQPQQR